MVESEIGSCILSFILVMIDFPKKDLFGVMVVADSSKLMLLVGIGATTESIGDVKLVVNAVVEVVGVGFRLIGNDVFCVEEE